MFYLKQLGSYGLYIFIRMSLTVFFFFFCAQRCFMWLYLIPACCCMDSVFIRTPLPFCLHSSHFICVFSALFFFLSTIIFLHEHLPVILMSTSSGCMVSGLHSGRDDQGKCVVPRHWSYPSPSLCYHFICCEKIHHHPEFPLSLRYSTQQTLHDPHSCSAPIYCGNVKLNLLIIGSSCQERISSSYLIGALPYSCGLKSIIKSIILNEWIWPKTSSGFPTVPKSR